MAHKPKAGLPTRPHGRGGPMLLMVLGLSAVLLLWRLDDWETTEIMELLHLQSSREMYLSGDWVLPTLWGEPRLQKPPLPNWAAAATGRLFGRFDLFTARLPSVAAALAMIAMTFLLARRMFPMRRVGVFAALSLAGMYFVAADQGRAAIWDIYVAAFTTGCLHACWRAMERPERWAVGWWAIAGLWLGAAGLSKGPVVLVVPLGTILPMLVIDACRRENGDGPHFAGKLSKKDAAPPRNGDCPHLPAPTRGAAIRATLLRRGLGIGLMLAIAVALAAPWVAAVLVRLASNPAGVWETWREEILRDTYVAEVDHSIFTYLLFFALIWPATPYVVAGLISTFTGQFRAHRRAMLFAFCWVVGGLVLFSLAPERRPRYIIGLAPGAALAAGALWARQRELLADGYMDRKHFGLILAHWVLIAAPAAAGLVYVGWNGWLPWAVAVPIAAAAACASVVGLRLHLRRRVSLGFAIGWSVAAVAMLACLSGYIDSPLARVPEKPIADDVLALAGGRPILYAGIRPSNAFGYYATVARPVRELDHADGELQTARREGGAILLLGYLRESDWERDPAQNLRRFDQPVPRGFRLAPIRRPGGRVVHEIVNAKKDLKWYAVELLPQPPATAPSRPASP